MLHAYPLHCSNLSESLYSLLIIKHDLLVQLHVGSFFLNLFAELVKGLNSSICVRVSTRGFPIFIFEAPLLSLGVTQDLRQVLGAASSVGPLELLGVPLRFLWLVRVFLVFFGWDLVTFFVKFGGYFLLLLFNWLLNHIASDFKGSRLLIAQQADNTTNFANVTFDREEFIHNTHLHFLLLRLEFVGVAEAFEKNETLICAVFANLLFHELHNELLVEVHGGV